MEKFFYPRSMVVIGASVKRLNLGHIIVLNNRQHNYEGNIYGVGREEGDIAGAPVYDSVEKIPEVPDVAIIIAPAETVPDFMDACGKKGIKRLVIESGGFSEYSQGQNVLEKKVLEIADRYGMRFIGPNCIGTINFDIKMMMPFGFFPRTAPGGRVAMIVQSGGVGGSYLGEFGDNAIIPGKFAAIGNKLQIDEVDVLEYLLNDDKTDVVAMYLEGFKRGRAFFDLAVQSDKPLIVLKSNRSDLTAKIAQSHTTALSADDQVVDGAFRQTAVIRVDDDIDFINAVKIIRLPLMKSRRVAILSRSGGHAVMSVDACAKFGFSLVDFPPAFIENLKTIYNTRVIAHQNPLDLGEIFDYTIFTQILEEALKLPDVDGVLFNHLYIADYEGKMSRDFLSNVGKLVQQYQKPVAMTMVTDTQELVNISKNQSYPIFTTPLTAAKALNMSATYYEEKTAREARGRAVQTTLDMAAIDIIQDKCKTQKRIPLTDESLRIVEAAGIKSIAGATVKSAKEAGDVSLHFPVAVKLLSRDASHKSDIGGVRLNIKNQRELKKAISDIKKSLKEMKPRPAMDGFLIQEMSADGVECFVGGRQDPVFGPIVIAGLGGIFLEIFRDTSIRLAPVTKSEALDMLKNLQAYPILQGARGKMKADIDAFADVICRVSNLLAAVPDIAEIDLNPVIVHEQGKGVSIVDSRIFFK
ncbi:MAG TPA: acetate--CoA ligase family protein [Smithella sp.]|nr:acetate--CoA ligase family protein [Smithella sp.]HPK21618.1 acetate--CoA ligase family protein [Smithella sp.]HPV51223.1 acetate--CoA ligase family protein [Smithella sp.]HQI23616.1 acetate--CoA ligase family protein [Smithella sp.]